MLHRFMNLEPSYKYEKLKFIGDGTYSNVYKVRSRALFHFWFRLFALSSHLMFSLSKRRNLRHEKGLYCFSFLNRLHSDILD